MAVCRSRLHFLMQACVRCTVKNVGKTTVFGQQYQAHVKLRLLSHRCLWSSRQTICRLCIHHQHWLPKQHKLLKFPFCIASPITACLMSTAESSSIHLIQNPYQLVQSEMSAFWDNIQCELHKDQGDLGTISRYYFDGKGKAFRPLVVMLMAKACNFHQKAQHALLDSQMKIAMIAEMLHTATLIHDDVIDASNARRGKASVHYVWGQRKAVLAGDYILSILSILLARIGNPEVVSIMSKIVDDLVRGEFMQLGSKEDEKERFAHYLDKTFKKTASMFAASCKSVAVLGGCSDAVSHVAYQYGRNLGIAFQLVDDMLDFVSSDQDMGKPTAADLKLGLATAPVLFAALQFPQLNTLIMRRFSQEGDVETARQLVAKSDGIEQTKLLAAQHTKEAVQLLQQLVSSSFQRALLSLTQTLLTRQK